MNRKLLSVFLAAMICATAVFPAIAATTTYTMIESVSITLKYNDFKAGSSDDEGSVTVILNDAGGHYQLDNSAMSVPQSGWTAGDVPNLRLTLVVTNEDTTRFAYSASRPSGVSVDGGQAHYGELRSSGKKVYYEIHLNEVQENEDDKWEDERDWGTSDTSSGGPGAQGAWLKDPNTGRYWYSNADGTRNVYEWQKIGGVWYFFDETGYRVENKWVKWKGKDYYLGKDGRMYSNERTPDGFWVNKDGSWDGKPKNK